jgi:hypothetical protein
VHHLCQTRFCKREKSMIDWIRPPGFTRFALIAIAVNQPAPMICSLAGAKITPIPAIIGATVFCYWDLILLPRATASISDRANRIAEESRHLRTASYLLAMPLLWFAVHSCVKGSICALSIWKVLNIVYLGEIAGVCLLLGRRGFRYLAVTSGSQRMDS